VDSPGTKKVATNPPARISLTRTSAPIRERSKSSSAICSPSISAVTLVAMGRRSRENARSGSDSIDHHGPKASVPLYVPLRARSRARSTIALEAVLYSAQDLKVTLDESTHEARSLSR